MALHLETVNLTLELQTPVEALEAAEALFPAAQAETLPGWLARLKAGETPDPWLLGFRLVHRESGQAVGTAGFRGPPDAEGAVELFCHIGHDHEGKGYAGEVVGVLATYALGRGEVELVFSHTPPHESAPTRVLAKSGFRRQGEVADPQVGRAWRWEKRRSA